MLSGAGNHNEDGQDNRLHHIVGARKFSSTRHSSNEVLTNWKQCQAMPKGYDPPPESSHLWEAIKMLVILCVSICAPLYGVFMLNAYLDAQHKEIPIYGDTAAPLPGRGAGPPNVTWGGGGK